jgi:hypothetical protein
MSANHAPIWFIFALMALAGLGTAFLVKTYLRTMVFRRKLGRFMGWQ